MKAYVVFVSAYFVVFALFHAWLLVMARFEIRRHASRYRQHSLRAAIRSPLAPPISILVPAYNEEAGIADSIRSLLAMDYPNFELVIVNDGSSDDTVKTVIDAFDLRPIERPTPPFVPHKPIRGVYLPAGRLNLILLDKENGGKADALN